MPRRYKRKEKSISVSVRCLSCQKLFTKTAKLYPNGHEITCSGLSKHITTNKNAMLYIQESIHPPAIGLTTLTRW